ncbi:TIGR04211 family SH3 domain-containing protein [Actinobacillus equuli]|uniref:TIGR04211 family SH3 domain-containing protein n=1 Tax=Actinobacillus equuli TaxID=718 RepID=UPI0024430A93|nr:TIGR04211 family SH3 domain-containing protein [Actinobacillus equuli]WGE42991.1 TIGR04211 family SH3 domain-containing protein [Actinobacillus equuli subsp. haemolyticus]WGE47385.1 TIGR04211 family SH3 domain-containing protein [Actinobacillus equuli subsp. haemolyticus]WGE53708.1 TIGR04211 family SH3 domain-containing protein [Actinobacillus equuli subsp. haemolyticus]WGE70049.1 TIGR04211 family SH3 domain-containing protein [Actinobacillus equuli subsp. haemolyticus]WGE74144.1 TIGR04211 
MLKRKSTLLACLLLGTSLPAFSADYITENLSTYMRKGAGDQYKISGAIQAGEKVTVLDRKDRFVLIRDSKNREGWVLASEISQTASPKDLIPQLQQQVQDLSAKLGKIDSDWQQRTVEMQRRSQQAEQQSSELLDQNAQLKRELEVLKNKNRDLETMHDSEKREIVIQWFIYGGSVLAAGLLLGLLIPFILPRRRRNNGWS